jgi:hypothetical protein
MSNVMRSDPSDGSGPHARPGSTTSDDSTEILLADVFDDDARRGAVIGTASTSGTRREGADAERSLSIDHGALRIRPRTRPGWNRAAIRYGPWPVADGIVLSAALTSGRNASTDAERWPSWWEWTKRWLRGTEQDPPATRVVRSLRFTHRDEVGRRLRTAWVDARRQDADRSDVNLAFGWCRDPRSPLDGVAFAVQRNAAGFGELCLVERGEVQVLARLTEIPFRLALVAAEGRIAAFAAFDDATGVWPDLRLLAVTSTGIGADPLWATFDQRVLGEAGFGADTRLHEVRVERMTEVPGLAELGSRPLRIPTTLDAIVGSARAAEVALVDDDLTAGTLTEGVESEPSDLDGRRIGAARWRHVLGRRRIVPDANGALVDKPHPVPGSKLQRLMRATGQRTAYTIDWPGGAGVITAEIVPPGDGPGQGARGRGGLILYQDDDNYLIVNDWVDDAHEPAIGAFLRSSGFEEVYDAAWTVVDGCLTFGQRHVLRLAFDASGFAVDLDDRTVLARRFADLYPEAAPLEVRAVGICANWDFGEDTGSRFTRFTAGQLGP